MLSIWMIISSGLFTDLLPHIDVTNDVVLCAVFGGLLQGFAVCLTLFAGATSGGTDFISIYSAQKTGKDIWNIIFFSNCVVLAIYGFLFEWSYALYSIIFQFANTQVINTFYKRYKKTTLLVITQKPEEVVAIGDNVNDKEMLENAGLGIAMGNSAPYIKEIADLEHISINTALGRMRYAILNMRRIAAEKCISLALE